VREGGSASAEWREGGLVPAEWRDGGLGLAVWREGGLVAVEWRETGALNGVSAPALAPFAMRMAPLAFKRRRCRGLPGLESQPTTP
jgi:hypothetical protein